MKGARLFAPGWSKDYRGRGPRDLAQRVADYRAGKPVQPLDIPAVSAQC